MRIAITGAFSYTGKHLGRRLLEDGHRLVALTNHRGDSRLDGRAIPAFPLNFGDPNQLRDALADIDVLFNTFWIRFEHGTATFNSAVRDSEVLITAAKAAGVRRIIHVSIANPSTSAHQPYYRGKAQVEDIVRKSGLAYSIVRPTVIYGHGDVLINNIAWFLRHTPVFGIPGDGHYRIQPVFIEDYAELLARLGTKSQATLEIDAVGPDIFEFQEFVRAIKDAIGSRSILLNLPPRLALAAIQPFGFLVKDTVLTKEEINSLMEGLLVSRHPATCETKFRHWLLRNPHELGRSYASEMGRHFR